MIWIHPLALGMEYIIHYMELLSSMLNYGLAHGNLLKCLVENKSIHICQDLKQFNTAAVADFCSCMLNSNSRNAGSSQESKIHNSLRVVL